MEAWIQPSIFMDWGLCCHPGEAESEEDPSEDELDESEQDGDDGGADIGDMEEEY